MSREAVSSAVSSRVRVNFGEAKIIKHDRYLSHDLARQKSHQKFTRTREETAELTASRDFLLSCFLSCAPGLRSLICSDQDGEPGFGQGGSSSSKTCWCGDYQITSGEKTLELPKKHSSKFAKLLVQNLPDKILLCACQYTSTKLHIFTSLMTFKHSTTPNIRGMVVLFCKS